MMTTSSLHCEYYMMWSHAVLLKEQSMMHPKVNKYFYQKRGAASTDASQAQLFALTLKGQFKSAALGMCIRRVRPVGSSHFSCLSVMHRVGLRMSWESQMCKGAVHDRRDRQGLAQLLMN
eukprot:3462327-Amphidinium_carterae.2